MLRHSRAHVRAQRRRRMRQARRLVLVIWGYGKQRPHVFDERSAERLIKVVAQDRKRCSCSLCSPDRPPAPHDRRDQDRHIAEMRELGWGVRRR